MPAHLRPCPGCSRHVRVSERACPFCSATLDTSFQASPAPVGPSKRLSRAALFAFGTGTLVLPAAVAIGCFSAEPSYGGSPVPINPGPVPVGSVDASESSAQDTGSSVDASSKAETDGAANDAESEAGDAG
jgi:hypothetical protein